MTLDILTEDDGWHGLRGRSAVARRAVDAVFAIVGKPEGETEVSIVFAGDAKVAELNGAWRGKPRPTNVLSFPAPAPHIAGAPRPLGDIVLAHGVVASEAEADGKPLASHVSHLIVHGLLHLLGYDHDEEDRAEAMRAIEIAAQRSLGYGDPYEEKPRAKASTRHGP